MKFNKSTQFKTMFFCFLIIVLINCFVSSSLKRKEKNKIKPEKLRTITDEDIRTAMNVCFICRGPAELYRHKENKEKIICECIIDGVKYYSRGHDKIDSSKVPKDFEEKFEKLDLHAELKQNCKSFCPKIIGVFETANLYKIVGEKRNYICKCTGLLKSQYYIMEGDDIEKSAPLNDKQLKLVHDIENKKDEKIENKNEKNQKPKIQLSLFKIQF